MNLRSKSLVLVCNYSRQNPLAAGLFSTVELHVRIQVEERRDWFYL